MLLVLLYLVNVAEVNVVFWEERQSSGLSKGRKRKH